MFLRHGLLLAAAWIGGLAIGVPGSGTALSSATDPGPELLVTNQTDRNVSFIGLRPFSLQGSVPVDGVTGHEVEVSPDGRTAYVPIYGSSGVGRPGTDGQLMRVIDVRSRKVTGTVDFGHGVRPHCVVFDSARHVLYVTTELDNSVTVVDAKTLRIVGSIPTGQPQSHMLALSHDGHRGYTANVGPGTVSVLDMDSRKTIAVVRVSGNVQRIAVSNDDRWVFTADQTSPRMAVIDARTNQMARWVDLPGSGYGSMPTRDGRYLLMTLRDKPGVAVVDLAAMKVVRTIEVAKGPAEVRITKDGSVAYVSSPMEGKVMAISITGDPQSWKVVGAIASGGGADGMALAGG